jgi:hypothetical protein
MSDVMSEIRARLQAKVPEAIESYGFFMSKGSFTKLPAGVTTGFAKMLGGLKRKKSGGDLSGTTTTKAAWGLDNHQTALVVTAGNLYAIDTTTSLSGKMSFGDVLGSWPRSELMITGTSKSQPRGIVLVNLDIRHEPTGEGGQLETMTYVDKGDPSYDCYRVLAGE